MYCIRKGAGGVEKPWVELVLNLKDLTGNSPGWGERWREYGS